MSFFDYFQTFQSLVPFAVGLTIIAILNYTVSCINRLRKLPPGPWGLPIVGYLPFLNDVSYIFFDKLAKKYGPVYSLRLGQRDVVVICDWENLKIALADEALLARPHTPFKPGNIPSFMEMSGDIWREHRRLSLHILRDVGFGKSAMETLITKEIAHFLSKIDGKNVDFIAKIHPSVSNIISSFLFGKTFDYSDTTKLELDENMEKATKMYRFAGFQAFLPWLQKILAFLGIGNSKAYRKCIDAIEDIISFQINEHLAKKKGTTEIVDYIDGYIQEHDRRKSKGDYETFHMKFLKRNSSVFFAAGYETITSTLSWAMLYLVHNPEFQNKIREEIGEVIGYERKPNYADRNQMPFTMAFLYEVQRIGSVIATNLLRRAACDTKVGKYFIPKDTIVIFNLYSIHREEKLWPEPEKFDPNRFLVDNGAKVVKPPCLVPFSGGKRACPGEILANVELFLYLVSILQKYRIKSEPVNENQCKEAVFGITRRPKFLPSVTFEKIFPQ